MSWIDGYIAGYWSKFEKTCHNDPDSLNLFRVAWAIFVLAFFTPHFSWLGDVPGGLFTPPILSLAVVFPNFPSKWVFVVVDIALIVSILFVGLGIKARISAVCVVALAIFGSTFQYSFGKIDHGILLWATLLCLSQTNWSTAFALVPDKPVSAQQADKALALGGVLIAFGMFTAGLPKLIVWVDFDTSTSGFLAWFYQGYFTLDRQHLAAPFVLNIPERAFEILDYGAVLFELGAFACLLAGRKAWHAWLLTACLFHFGNTLLLNISFINHVPVYLMFFPLATLINVQELNARRVAVVMLLLFLGTAQFLQNFVGIRFQLDSNLALMMAAVAWPTAALTIALCIYREGQGTYHLSDRGSVKAETSIAGTS